MFKPALENTYPELSGIPLEDQKKIIKQAEEELLEENKAGAFWDRGFSNFIFSVAAALAVLGIIKLFTENEIIIGVMTALAGMFFTAVASQRKNAYMGPRVRKIAFDYLSKRRGKV